MGVAGLWDVIRPAAQTRSLTHLSVTEGFVANPAGLRGFRIGIDASIWFFHAEYGREGENPVLRTLFFRCATLMNSPFLPLFVFDGPKRPDFKRGKKINRTGNKLVPGMKAILESFGFEWRQAPGEAEAELAYLNRIGLVDGILSDDVDNFLFGATTVIRNPSNNLSGNKANPVLNAAGKDDKNHTRVFRMADITSHPDIQLTRGGMILIGLMSGGDYQQAGLPRCGVVTAHGLARCGFGDSLYQAATTLSRDALEKFLINWRHELSHELRTNSQGLIGRKQPSLAKSIPDDFPDIDILLSYTNPITSESMGRAENNAKLTWSKEPDLGKLAATCEFYFEWGYKEAIIKRFRTVIWHGAILRILRRAVLDQDERPSLPRAPAPEPPSTPRKSGKRAPLPIGTPSKMIAKYFSHTTLAPSADSSHSHSHSDDTDNERLILKIHSSRQHVSTDGTLEYRLEVAPGQLVRLAESGIKGTRAPEGPDEWADEDDDDDDGGKGVKKPPPDPQSHMRVWMPAVMVRIVEPAIVEAFEEVQQQKLDKKAGKGRGGKTKAAGKSKLPPAEELSPGSESDVPTSKAPKKAVAKLKPKTKTKTGPHPHAEEEEEESDEPIPPVPKIRDLTKKNASKPADVRNYFGAAKLSTAAGAAAKGKGKSVSSTEPSGSRHAPPPDSPISHNKEASPRPIVRDLTKKKLTLLKRTLGGPKPSSDNLRRKPSASLVPSKKPTPGYLSVSDSEDDELPQINNNSKTKSSHHLSHTAAFLDESRLYDSDDPFDNHASQSTRPPSPPPTQTRKYISSSPSSGSDLPPTSHLIKSPRNSAKHTSPRRRPKASTHTLRPTSPLPTVPQGSKTTTTSASESKPRVIEISDSEDDSAVGRASTSVAPLLLARARAQTNNTSKSTSSKKEISVPPIKDTRKDYHDAVIDLT